MGKFFDEIPDFIISWILQQEMFWVATAPLSGDGHVNVSPKGLAGTLHVVDCHQVWYEDCTGSGAETIAHLRENGRITVLLNAFVGPPRIVRLFGKGTVHEFGTPEYEALLPPDIRSPGSRSAIVIDVHKVGSSCGYAVPFYEFKSHRTQLVTWAANKENIDRTEERSSDVSLPPNGMRAYWAERNTKSLDGLPAVLFAHKSPVKPKDVERSVLIDKVASKSGPELGGAMGFIDVKNIISFSVGILVAVVYLKRTVPFP